MPEARLHDIFMFDTCRGTLGLLRLRMNVVYSGDGLGKDRRQGLVLS
jgi:hypothetical protein